MEGTMKDKELIRKELMVLMDEYYDGSFAQMTCDYIRSTGMTSEEVEELLEVMKHLGK